MRDCTRKETAIKMNSHQFTIEAIKTKRKIALTYTEEAVEQIQPRLKGRVSLRPNVNLNSFTARAVIDWLEIHFTTGRKTQAKWINARIKKATGLSCYAKMIAQKNGQKFKVRFQEPNLKLVFDAVDAIRSDMGINGDVLLAGIEISIDFTPKVPGDDDERARLMAMLMSHFMPAGDILSADRDRPRFTWKKKKKGEKKEDGTKFVLPIPAGRRKLNPLLFNGNDLQPYVDATVYYGSREGSRFWRIMDKVVDKQNPNAKTANALLDAEKRVRIEVCLRGEELQKLGLNTLDDLHGFKFTKLNPCFRFLQPTFLRTSPLPANRMRCVRERNSKERIFKFQTSGVVGLHAMDDAWTKRRKVLKKDLLAAFRNAGKKLPTRRESKGMKQTSIRHEELSDRADMALRKLTQRVCKQSKVE